MSKIRQGGTERARYWQPIVAEWSASGLSQAEFCRRRGIKAFNFNWWKRQLTARSQSNGDGESSPKQRRSASKNSAKFAPGKRARYSAPSFVEVKMAEGALSTGYEVVLSGGRVLRLPRAFDAEAVTRLIAAVEAAC